MHHDATRITQEKWAPRPVLIIRVRLYKYYFGLEKNAIYSRTFCLSTVVPRTTNRDKKNLVVLYYV